jgi:hypothetical protein
MDDERQDKTDGLGGVGAGKDPSTGGVPPACAIDPDTECPVCAARGQRVRMLPVKAHYQCPQCHYFDSCCM